MIYCVSYKPFSPGNEGPIFFLSVIETFEMDAMPFNTDGCGLTHLYVGCETTHEF